MCWLTGRRQLDQVGRPVGYLVEGLELELDLSFIRYGHQVQHSVGRAAQGRVHGERVADAGLAQEAAGGPALAHHLDRRRARVAGKGQPGGERGGDGRVAGKRETEGLHDAAHGVGGEQPGAGAAGGADRVLQLAELLGRHVAFEVFADALEDLGQADFSPLVVAGQHGAAGDQHHRDVEPRGRHDHARDDLVAVGDEHQAVQPVGLGHDLHRVGDDFARHQGVVHALVVHRQAVADADDVELQRDAAALVYPVLDLLGDGVQVHMPGDELVVRVGYPDERPVGVAPADAESP